MYGKNQKSAKDSDKNSTSSHNNNSSNSTPRTMHRMSKAERYRWIFKDSATKSNNTSTTTSSAATANSGVSANTYQQQMSVRLAKKVNKNF